jgi:DNA-binding MarR family transcriptional regulator
MTSRLQREIKQTKPFGSAAQETTIAILRTADVVRTHLAEVIEPAGVTLQQYNVLRILRGSHPEPLATLEIGERMIERQPGVTRLLDRLEAKGLVRRERCPTDRRIVHASITPGGLDLLEELDAPIQEAEDIVQSSLSTADLRTLIRLLERIRIGGG